MTQSPAITITSRDMDRLETLMESLPAQSYPVIEALEAELHRATIVAPDKIAPNVVTMNSTVRFALLPSGTERTLKLVYPGGSDSGTESVSILAPVGSALLGLAEGDEIHWNLPTGGSVSLLVLQVEYQPERAGSYDL